MLLSRRNALRSLFFAAPAIVAAPTLMRVSAKFLMPVLPPIALVNLTEPLYGAGSIIGPGLVSREYLEGWARSQVPNMQAIQRVYLMQQISQYA